MQRMNRDLMNHNEYIEINAQQMNDESKRLSQKWLGVALIISSTVLLYLSMTTYHTTHNFDRIETQLKKYLSLRVHQDYQKLLQKQTQKYKEQLTYLDSALEQKKKLLQRLETVHIQDDQDEDQIQEIVKAKKNIVKHKTLLDYCQNDIKVFIEQDLASYQKMPTKYQKNQIIRKEQFQQKGRKTLAIIHEKTQELKETNKKIYKKIVSETSRITKLEESQKVVDIKQSIDFQQTIQLLPQFKSMPLLARKILSTVSQDFTDYFYGDVPNFQYVIELRKTFWRTRNHFIASLPQFKTLSLIKYNMVAIKTQGDEQNKWRSQISQQYKRLNEIYKFDEVEVEQPMCVIVPSYNNNKQFRVQLNLNSIFFQNYTNYRVVIIDDASNDGTQKLIQKYINYYHIPNETAKLIFNKQSKKALQNIYKGILNHCKDNQIVVIVDGDDELIGFNVLKTINAVYLTEKIGFLYSNFYFYMQDKNYAREGFNSQFTDQQKNQKYRNAIQRFSHLITFQADLVKQLKQKDLKDQNGNFFKVSYDFALFYPLMQLSCGHVKQIKQLQYLYNTGTGLNDYQLYQQSQKKIGEMLLKYPPYECSKNYKK